MAMDEPKICDRRIGSGRIRWLLDAIRSKTIEKKKLEDLVDAVVGVGNVVEDVVDCHEEIEGIDNSNFALVISDQFLEEGAIRTLEPTKKMVTTNTRESQKVLRSLRILLWNK
ncbi:hypothetical protein E2542_SST25183 [Spatholobus suberectus]|nr:hypothetical protein E2542_SST25183 [Spatholobus suberectus]